MSETILAVGERSGLIEEYHTGAVAVVDPAGNPIAVAGDIDRPFYIRSAAKPFQAFAALEAGLSLPMVQLAVACASHSGDPVHVALVEDILAAAALGTADLQCPPARPFPSSDRRLAAGGDLEFAPVYHNCSGKHAAMLAACEAAGWEPSTYRDPDHPLQRRVASLLSEVTSMEVGSPGVDGCGAPVWRVTVLGLARAFSRLGSEERFDQVRTAMARYPMLVSGERRPDGLIGRWIGVPAKGGAAGCIGVSAAGFGIGAKAWSGSGTVAAMGAIAGLDHLGVVTSSIAGGLEEVAEPPVLGGGKKVGRFRRWDTLETL